MVHPAVARPASASSTSGTSSASWTLPRPGSRPQSPAPSDSGDSFHTSVSRALKGQQGQQERPLGQVQ
eukprot:11097550-Lingulodinium_polyedra.AAC.1